MAIDPRDKAFLDRAEAFPVDAVAMAETFDEMQEREDVLSYEKRVHISRSLAEAVRLDVFRVLAIACKDELTLKRFVESLAEERVKEQFDTIADPDERAKCVREVFDDIAEEAVDTVLPFDERYAGLDPRKKKYNLLVRKYVRMLAERHGITAGNEDGEANGKLGNVQALLSKHDERELIRNSAVAGVSMAAVRAAFRELAEADDGDAHDDQVTTSEALGTAAFFDVLDALSDATGGTITMKGFKQTMLRANVRAALFRLDRKDRSLCLQSLVYEIAQSAVMSDPSFKKAIEGREHEAEFVASGYALRLIAMYS